MTWEHWPITTETDLTKVEVWAEFHNALDQRSRAAELGPFFDIVEDGTDWFRLDRFSLMLQRLDTMIPLFINSKVFVDNQSTNFTAYTKLDFASGDWALAKNSYCVETTEMLNELYRAINALQWRDGPAAIPVDGGASTRSFPVYQAPGDPPPPPEVMVFYSGEIPPTRAAPGDTSQADARQGAKDYWDTLPLTENTQTWFLFRSSSFTHLSGDNGKWYGFWDTDWTDVTFDSSDAPEFLTVSWTWNLYAKGTVDISSLSPAPDGKTYIPNPRAPTTEPFEDPLLYPNGESFLSSTVPSYTPVFDCQQGVWHLVDGSPTNGTIDDFLTDPVPVSTVFDEPDLPSSDTNFAVENADAYGISGRPSGAKWIRKFNFTQQDPVEV